MTATFVTQLPASGSPLASCSRSLDEFRASALAWDQLWERSEVCSPICRAEPLAIWHEAFAPQSSHLALGVWQGERLVAGLPLFARPVARFLESAALPTNWGVAAGDLLLDPQCDQPAVLDSLVAAMEELDTALIWLEGIAYEEPRWQLFLAAARRHGWGVDIREQHHTAQVEIQPDWETYFATRTPKQRNNRRAEARKLESAGDVQLRLLNHVAPGEVAELLETGFAVEARSWKRDRGSCVLQDAHLMAYFNRVAVELARHGQLHLAFLDFQERPIAFSFGWQAKGAAFGVKIGCDQAKSKFAPGHQLILRGLQEYHRQGSLRLVDFVGPLAPWHESWATRTYPVGRVVLAYPNRRSRALLYMYRNWQPQTRWLASKLRLLSL